MDTKNTTTNKPAAKSAQTDTIAAKKRSKAELKDILAQMSDPEKVLASPDIISARDLLRVSYELGEYHTLKKSAHKIMRAKNSYYRRSCSKSRPG
jgi:hypothetical protein